MAVRSFVELKNRFFVGIIGPSKPNKEIYQLAYKVGKEIGKRKWILICGGLKGVMEAAAKGAKEEGTLTIGILPQIDKSSANPYIDIPIATGLNEARNLAIVLTSDIIIALGKGYGTLSEIAFALKYNKKIFGLKTWNKDLPIIKVKSIKELIKKISNLAY
ncbi:MAG: TIGR00725 family protein [candidate division WOR-3 bacterium]|nr:TIGR00725 family protein [candidate division WOR-3 bacterium]MDW8113639.1 TIGR00725 family protein [candidate division WOR-3 bacterium]